MSAIGFRINKQDVALPNEPFATMAATWLRIGTSAAAPDALVLQFTSEPGPNRFQRQKAGAKFGGMTLIRALTDLGWEPGEYELVSRGNCWIVTKRRVR